MNKISLVLPSCQSLPLITVSESEILNRAFFDPSAVVVCATYWKLAGLERMCVNSKQTVDQLLTSHLAVSFRKRRPRFPHLIAVNVWNGLLFVRAHCGKRQASLAYLADLSGHCGPSSDQITDCLIPFGFWDCKEYYRTYPESEDREALLGPFITTTITGTCRGRRVVVPKALIRIKRDTPPLINAKLFA